MKTKISNPKPLACPVLLPEVTSVYSVVKKVFLTLSVLSVLSVVQPAFAQSGEVKVESKLRIVPSGDIAMGVFQPASSTGGTTGGGTGGGTTLTPPPATGLYGWYSADEVYAETSGTPLSRVTIDAAPVGSLKDISGNNRHMFQSTDTRRPILKQNISTANGKPVLRFDGVDDYIRYYPGDPLPVNFSLYLVVKRLSSVINKCLFSDHGVYNFLNFNYGSVNNTLTFNSFNLQLTTALPSTDQFNAISVSCKNGGTSYLVVNNQISSSNTATQTSRGTGFDFGSGFYDTYANFDLAEAIIYNTAQDPNSGDGLNVRKYLDTKYGLGLFTAPTAPPTTNQFAWYSADEAYTETIGTPTTKVTVNNSTVGSLKDQSGNSRNLYQATTANQPTFKTAAVNGKPAILFDGSSDMLSSLSQGNQTQPITAYFIIKQTGTTNNRGGGRIFCFPAVNQQYLFEAIQSGEGSKINLYSTDSSVGGGNSDLSLNQYGLFMVKLNGAQSFSKAGSSTEVNYVGSNTSLLDKTIIGNYVGGSTLYAGLFEFAEAIIYTSAHDPATGDGLTVRKYLDNKYNLGLGLNGAQLPAQNLYASYKSDEAYKDTGLTQLCSVSGTDTVAALKDLSNNGRHLIQATTDLMPKWFSNQKASKPAIRFDGLNDYLKGIFNINQPMTVVSLVKQNTRVDARYLMDGATVNSGRISQTSNNFTLSQYAGSNTTLDNPNASVGNYMLLYSTFDGANSKFLIDNSTAITGNCGTGSMGGLTLGANGNGANNSNIDLVETTVYNVALDPATGDGLKVRQYYSDKYALSLFGTTGGSELTAPAGMFAQYTADNAYKDTALTQKCSTAGDVVMGIKDASPNNRSLTVVDTAQTPTWQSNVLNTKAVWRTPNGSKQLRNSIPLTGPYVIYYVSNATGNSNFWADNPSFSTQVATDPLNFFATSGTTWQPAPAGFALNQWQMTVFQMSGTGYFKINNNASTNHAWSPSLAGIVTAFRGDVAEILIYSAQHDPNSGVGLDVRKYLNTKYNLGLTLP